MSEIIDDPFKDLAEEVLCGIEGKGINIPIGMHKLGKYASIRKKILTLLFSSSGSGKSSLASSLFILNPYDHLLSSLNTTGIKMKTVFFSMERAKKYIIAKWIVRKIFQEHQIKIAVPKLMGWYDSKLTKNEHDLFLMYEDYIKNLLEYIDIYEGPRTSADIYRILKEKFKAEGTYHKIDEYKEVYEPNDEHTIYNIVLDHGNLIKTSSKEPTKKQAIDQTTEYLQSFRDKESAHILWVAQVNRDMSSPMRLKSTTAELNIDDVKQSGDVGDACDLALTLFDPLKYRQDSLTGYKPEDFVDENDGSKYFRSLTIAKSTYGADDLRIPLAFNGCNGDFRELPRRKDLTDNDYQNLLADVKSGRYFYSDYKSSDIHLSRSTIGYPTY